MFSRRLAHLTGLLATGMAFAVSNAAEPYYSQPAPYNAINQFSPPGMAGNWAGAIGRATPSYMQPVQVLLPTEGQVTFYRGGGDVGTQQAAPARAHFGVGFLYRVRIGEMPEYPGVELYPSIELVDRLHPPAGAVEHYPVPVEITAEEIEIALNGQLVTKVVYIEQPQVAATPDQLEESPIVSISPRENPVAEAERRGRPVAIVRLGGRLPNASGADPFFFGPPVPLGFPRNVTVDETAAATITIPGTP